MWAVVQCPHNRSCSSTQTVQVFCASALLEPDVAATLMQCFKCGGHGWLCACHLRGCQNTSHRKDSCDACKGSGSLTGFWTKCLRCGGHGWLCGCLKIGCLNQSHRKDGCSACKGKGASEHPGGTGEAGKSGQPWYFHGTRIHGTVESILLNGLSLAQLSLLMPYPLHFLRVAWGSPVRGLGETQRRE